MPPLPVADWSRDMAGMEPPIMGNPLDFGEDVSGEGGQRE
jgi:hypothetical protein